ncbi:response regulator transcription factor [Saccharopolyspora erythraea]|uniref:response regulator n=1 Tax=Saccharopolyspora erythraea TaxID=1836 RepID=UPI001BF0A70F|nr:response regulator transcription factor [Saccharopolyspora erythraea]QUH04561.1 response regulator transcription factor [Saccharopolyspora erythraea]
MLRLIIADDQPATRDGLRMLLAGEPGIDLLGAAVDGRDLVAMARHRRPDVVLTDIRMPGMDGLAAIRELTALDPAPSVVALTTFDVDEYLFGALQAGAVGFLLKDSDPALFVEGLRAAHQGQGLIDPQVTRRLVRRFADTSPRPATPALGALTPRETEVLRLLAQGLTNSDIAGTLFIALGTVKLHVARILDKLEVRTRVQAAIYAHRHGLVTWADETESGHGPAS